MQVMDEEEVYYTPKEIAEQYKMTEAAIRKFMREGKLKHVRLGASYRISATNLQEFLHASQDRKKDKPEYK